MGRIGRSFKLVGQSYRILMLDKELILLPLLSGVVIAIVVAGLAFGFGLDIHQIERHGPEVYAPLFLMYVVTYAVGIFFQAAVVAGATDRMRGGDPTVASALSAAWDKALPIVAWAVVAATVGIILKVIQDRVGVIGKIVASLLGAAWSLGTFFVVPVLVLEDRSLTESVARSASVFKKTWGETVVGGVSLGVAVLCAWVTLVAVAGLLAMVAGALGIAVFFLGAIALAIFFPTLQGVYLASLFRYATDGETDPEFDRSLFEQAFQPKRR